MKELSELNIDDSVYIYSIINLVDTETVTKSEAKVYRIGKSKDTVSVYEKYDSEFPIRRVLKSNEGIVYRNSLWFSEENDELAKAKLLEHFRRKIDICENDIKLYKSRIDKINKFFK